MMAEIGLGEAIRALREELTAAKGEAEVAGERMRFQVSPVELELHLVVTKTGKGKVGWKILEVGGSVDSASTQIVKLTLTPQWWDATDKQFTPDWLVSGLLPPEPPTDMPGTEAPVAMPERDDDPENG